MNSNIRIITAALVFIVIIAASVLIYTAKINSRKISSHTEQSTSANANNNAIVFKENNLYGVMNSENEIIIEPKWDFIYSPARGKYIVGESKYGVMYYGALDENGAIAIPIVYDSIDVFNSEILAAKSFEGGYAIYDIELRSFSNEEYVRISENTDGSYEIVSKDVVFTIIVENKNIYIKKLDVLCNIDKITKRIEVLPNIAITHENAQNYISVVNESAAFIEAMFYGNSEGRYTYTLMDDSVLLGENSEAAKSFDTLVSITPQITRSDEGIKYESCVSFTYGVLVADSENPDELVNNVYEVNAYLTLLKDFEGDLKTASCVFSNS